MTLDLTALRLLSTGRAHGGCLQHRVKGILVLDSLEGPIAPTMRRFASQMSDISKTCGRHQLSDPRFRAKEGIDPVYLS